MFNCSISETNENLGLKERNGPQSIEHHTSNGEAWKGDVDGDVDNRASDNCS